MDRSGRLHRLLKGLQISLTAALALLAQEQKPRSSKCPQRCDRGADQTIGETRPSHISQHEGSASQRDARAVDGYRDLLQRTCSSLLNSGGWTVNPGPHAVADGRRNAPRSRAVARVQQLGAASVVSVASAVL